MNPVADIAAYIVSAMTNVTTKVTINSISPVDVGDIGTDLADLLLPYLQIINNYGLTGGTTAPNDIDGQDLDQYIRINGTTFYVYRKVGGTWGTPLVQLTFGVTFPDGPLINLRVAVSGFDATVTPGGWVINNVIYQKLTQTAFVIPAADLNFDRYDLIYADTSGQVLYTAGVASSTPAFPTTPANTIVVDYIIVPSSSSGNLPYSYYGSAGGDPASSKLISGTSDVNGEYDASGDGIGEFPLFTIYDNNGLQAQYSYDNANKKIIYMPSSMAFTARFSI